MSKRTRSAPRRTHSYSLVSAVLSGVAATFLSWTIGVDAASAAAAFQPTAPSTRAPRSAATTIRVDAPAPNAATTSPAPAPAPAPAPEAAAITPTLPDAWVDQFQWRSVGPANMGGRTVDIEVYEADPNIWWAATASGGLLKTTNGGMTFEHQFDREATVSIGDVAVAPSTPDIVWVGTGEHNPRNSVSWGDGVYKSVDGGKTWKNMGLRESFQIGRILVHPQNPDIVYVGALGRLWGPNAERGLYKTEDGGSTWQQIHHVDDRTGVIDMIMHPNDPDTLIFATYERQRDGFDSNDPIKKWGPGSGLWKTSDGGKTFRRLEEGLPSCNLGRIGLDWYAADPNIVFAVIESEEIGLVPEDAAHLGMRGESVEVGARLTEVTENGPAALAGLQTGDIVIGVGDERVVSYEDLVRKIRNRKAGDTATFEVSRNREIQAIEVTFGYRPGIAELLKVEDPAAAAKKARDEAAAAAAKDEGDPKAEAESAAEEESQAEAETEAEVKADEPAEPELTEEERRTRSRALRSDFGAWLGGQQMNIQDQQGPDGHEFGGVYKSEDGGESWQRINSLNPRPMYFSKIRVDPSDQNYVYVLGIPLFRSNDGGKTFTDDGGGNDVHVDHHGMWVNPNDGRHIILGNDGGIYVTRDRMSQWDHLNHMAIGQFYHVGVDTRENYMIYGGLQDNGSWGGPSRGRSGGPVNEDWFRIGGGDGFICFADPRDPDVVYYASQNGGLGRTNLRTGERGFLRPRGRDYRFNWMTPYLLSHHNSGVYYTAGNHVFRSMFQGNEIFEISPDLTLTKEGTGSAFGESRFDPNILYVGTTDGALWRTTNGGHEWQNLRELRKPQEETKDETKDETPGEEASAEAPAAAAEGSGDAASAAEAGPGETPPSPPAEGRRDRRGPEGGFGGPGAGGRDLRNPRFGEMLMQRDANGNGKIEREELPERMSRIMDRFDTNKDGVIEKSEIDAVVGAEPAAETTGQAAAEAAAATPDAEAPAEAPAAPEAAPASDPLSGTWPGNVDMEGMDPSQTAFTLTLQYDPATGVVTGTTNSQMGTRRIENGKFDPATGKLTFTASEGDQLTFRFEARLEEPGVIRGTASAEIPGTDQTFEVPFTVRREGGAPAAPAVPAETSATDRPGPAGPGGGPRGGGRRGQQQSDRDPLTGPNDEYAWKTIDELVPTPLYVASLEPSRHVPGRVYLAIDGHRSNDDEPYLFVSEDDGFTWRSIRANLPTTAGPVRVLREDIESRNILYAGAEFGLWVSVDRGDSWTKFDSNLPTVAVHEIAQHETSGEIVAGTHGRSIWICDVTALRQMNKESIAQEVRLFQPNRSTYWRNREERGSTIRRFTGDNGTTSAIIYYALGRDMNNVSITVTDIRGETIKTIEGEGGAGLHKVEWNLREDVPEGSRRRFGSRVRPGTYLVTLKAGDTVQRQSLEVRGDPEYTDAVLWGEAYDAQQEIESMFGDDEESDDRPWWEGREF